MVGITVSGRINSRKQVRFLLRWHLLVLQVLMSDFTADDSARRTQLLNLVGDGAHSSRCVERATDIDSLEMLRYTHGTRVDPTRNNANDQAYISGAVCTWSPGNTECL